MKGAMKMKREGFSLIELVIAIAILAIFTGIISLSVAMLRSADTKGLASGINGSLTDLKAMTESYKGISGSDAPEPIYLHIYKNADGYYAHYGNSASFDVPDDAGDDERLGAPNLIVKAKNVDGSDVELDGTNSVVVKIQKKDGSYSEAPKCFEVYNGSSKDYTVVLAKNTGLHYIV